MIMRPVVTDHSLSPSITVTGRGALRSGTQSEAFILVSPAGVLGVMEGEAWTGGDGEGLPFIRIV